MKTSIREWQVIWVVGTLERLVHLGLISGPTDHIAPDAIDLYLKLDENVNDFLYDDELKELARYVIIDTCDQSPPQKTIDDITTLLLEYKNNRNELLRYALNHSYAS